MIGQISFINKNEIKIAFGFSESYAIDLKSGISKKSLEKKGVSLLLDALSCSKYILGHHTSGQPYFVNNPNLFVSISHSDGWFAVAIAPHEVGIDIQTKRNRMKEGADYFINENEQPFIENEESLHIIWCVKEALYKKNGGNYPDLKNQVTVRSIHEHTVCAISESIPLEIDFLVFKDVYIAFS